MNLPYRNYIVVNLPSGLHPADGSPQVDAHAAFLTDDGGVALAPRLSPYVSGANDEHPWDWAGAIVPTSDLSTPEGIWLNLVTVLLAHEPFPSLDEIR